MTVFNEAQRWSNGCRFKGVATYDRYVSHHSIRAVCHVGFHARFYGLFGRRGGRMDCEEAEGAVSDEKGRAIECSRTTSMRRFCVRQLGINSSAKGSANLYVPQPPSHGGQCRPKHRMARCRGAAPLKNLCCLWQVTTTKQSWAERQ